jgi:hypothetical protein
MYNIDYWLPSLFQGSSNAISEYEKSITSHVVKSKTMLFLADCKENKRKWRQQFFSYEVLKLSRLNEYYANMFTFPIVD